MSFSQTKEFYDLMCEFEKIFAHKRLDREEKPLWIKQHYYQDGSTNDLFCAYLYGYQNGRSVYM